MFTTSFPLADCPQVQCVHPYVAQQPDELSLELADVLNILEKTDDGKNGPVCSLLSMGRLKNVLNADT